MKPLTILKNSLKTHAARWSCPCLAVAIAWIATCYPAQCATAPTAGLGLWLKADAGITTNGATVSEWADQSGQGRHMVQTNAAAQPTLVTSGTSLPGVSFDGVNDFMTNIYPVNGLTGMTIFLLANSRIEIGGIGASGGENAAIFWNETVSWGTVYLSPFQKRINWRFGTTQVNNRQVTSRPVPIGLDYSISTIVKDEASLTDSLYVDGTWLASSGAKTNAIAGCTNIMNLGRGYNHNTYFSGEILEVLVYERTLSDGERMEVEQYLHDKYFANSLPAVAITEPALYSSAIAPANLTITADATDTDGTISRVEFYADGAMIGADLDGAPFSVSWNSVPVGSYNLMAKAIDNQGAYRYSAPVAAGVNSASGGPTYAGLSMWLKADAGVTLNGSSASAWADQSGQGHHATQGTAASQPAVVDAEIGKPALRFDGANDYMTFTLPVNGIEELTIVLVANERANRIVTGTTATTANTYAAIFWNQTATWGSVHVSPFQTRVNFRFGTLQANNTPFYARPASIGTDYSTTIARKAGPKEDLYIDGVQGFVDEFKSTVIDGCQDTASLGRGYNNNTYFMGDILEVLVYKRAINDTERMQIEQYLFNKYLANQVPAVAITSPAVNAPFSAPASIAIAVDASDADGTIQKVEFYSGNTLIGTDTTSPYSMTWSDVPAGSYLLTAKATDNLGAFRVSAPVAVGVNAASGPPYVGMALWLKGDAGVTLSGDRVSAWADQSGLGRNVTQGSAACRPMPVSSVTGLPGLRFDGLTNFLSCDLPVNDLTGMTIFLVANSTVDQGGGSTQAGNAAVFWHESASWGTVYLSPYQGQVNWRFGTTQTNNRQRYYRPALFGDEMAIYTAIKNDTVDSLYINGTLAMSEEGKLGAIAGCQNTCNIGRGYDNNTFFAGDILEVIVYSRALPEAERQLVESYLHDKYLANNRPTVQIISPSIGAAFPAGSDIVIRATAADLDGTVTQVQFYAEGTLVGAATASPFEVTWPGVATNGVYRLVAKAFDNGGANRLSAQTPVVVGPVPALPISDDFSGGTINSSLWTEVDLVGDCTLDIVGADTNNAHLRIAVPAARNHDAWNPNEAPLLLQPMADIDFEVEAKFSTVPRVQYQWEGIFFRDAAGAGLRFDLLHDGKTRLQAYVGRNIGVSGAAEQARVSVLTPIPFSGNAGIVYMRVKRQGQQWSFYTAPDGISWTLATTFSRAFSPVEVGVFGGNYQAAGNPPAFDILVDYFYNSAMPLILEDPGPRLAIALTPGGATVVVSWPESAAGYQLQATESLSVPDWTAVGDVPVVVEGQNTVALPVAGSTRFYRLTK